MSCQAGGCGRVYTGTLVHYLCENTPFKLQRVWPWFAVSQTLDAMTEAFSIADVSGGALQPSSMYSSLETILLRRVYCISIPRLHRGKLRSFSGYLKWRSTRAKMKLSVRAIIVTETDCPTSRTCSIGPGISSKSAYGHQTRGNPG